MHYYKSNRQPLLGDDTDPQPGALAKINSDSSVRMAAGAALVYHGYKRTDSVLWALFYGVVGRTNPLIGGVIAAAQGFGKKKGS